ncbi:MAG: copper oxidase, partial [Nitrosarchaeum sp.]|nr:copper oxidase [Nitrosarchaeum sp.]
MVYSSRTLIMITMLAVSASFLVFLVMTGITNAQSEEKVFVTHTGAVVKTTGEVIDPLYVASTMEFDPMEYLRNFEYGKITDL